MKNMESTTLSSDILCTLCGLNYFRVFREFRGKIQYAISVFFR